MIIKRDRDPWDSQPSGRPVSDVDEKALRSLVRLGNGAGRIPTGSTDVQGELAPFSAEPSDYLQANQYLASLKCLQGFGRGQGESPFSPFRKALLRPRPPVVGVPQEVRHPFRTVAP